MKLEEILVLLPCHTLEDFPVYHQGQEAHGLLAAWTSLWHPRFVASAQKMPTWARVDDPPETFSGRLMVIPQVSQGEIPAGWPERAESEGAVVVRGKTERREILSAALPAVENDIPEVAPELVADFLALGFSFLTVELLTRQMRYTSHIDEVYFENETVAAALAAVRGDQDEARDHLGRCFDVLVQARDQYYPVDSYLIDLVLTAPAVIGPAFAEEMQRPLPTNVLLSGEVLARMAEEQPESLSALRDAVANNRVTVVGGEHCERELPLLSPEEILAELLRGRETYRQHLGACAEVFGRRRFGLSQVLPQILHKLGFQGALHVTLDEGRFPQGEQSKTRWEGHDGSVIDALSRIPLEVTKPETFLNLSHTIGDAMDHDHVATICFARWPGQHSDWYDDIQRASAYGPVLGKFVALSEYFSSTDTPDIASRFEADEYQSPYLRQAVDADDPRPLSRHIFAFQSQAEQQAVQSLDLMASVLPGSPAPESAGATETGQEPGEAAQQAGGPRQLAAAVDRFARDLPKGDAGTGNGYLLTNPHSSARRFTLELSGLPHPPRVADHIRAAGERDGVTQAVVDVPAMGFAWVGPGEAAPAGKSKTVPIAKENVLQNEHLRATIKPSTGTLKAIHVEEFRGNLLSQQVALKLSTRKPRGVMGGWQPPTQPYTWMEAESVEVAFSTPLAGRIITRGLLRDEHGHNLARFEQQYTLWRGSRVLELEVTLEPDALPGSDPWDNYYACRFAWGDPDAHLWRSSGMVAHPNVVSRFEAPAVIDLRSRGPRIAIFPHGLPFHQRSGDQMLDTLLIVRGEEQRRFRFGIGIGLTHPFSAAASRAVGEEQLVLPATRPGGSQSSWLFHLSTRNVVATHWEPISATADRQAGFRVRLLETEGRGARTELSTFRPAKRAAATDFLGQTLCELPIEEGKIMIDLTGYEWLQVEATWAEG